MGGQTGGFLEGGIRQGIAVCFHDDVGAGHVFGVEPPVVAGCHLEGELFILQVIFSHIHVVAVAADIMEGPAGDFGTFLSALPADVAAFDQLLLDLDQVLLLLGDIQRGADGFQMLDFRVYLLCQLGEGFKGAFQLIILFKIFFCVFLSGQLCVQRDGNCFAGIVVDRLQRFVPGDSAGAIGVQQLSVNAVFVPLFRILHLLHLQVIFFDVALQSGGNDPTQVEGALADAGNHVFLRIVCLQQRGNLFVALPAFLRIGGQGKGRVFRRDFVLIDDAGRKASIPDILHHGRKGFPERFPVRFLTGGASLIRPSACPMTNLMGDGGRKSGEGHIERLIAVRRFGKNLFHEKSAVRRQGIFLFLRLRDKIGLAGQHLTDGADQPGDMLDGVDDFVLFIAENDVAVLAHDFCDQLFMPQVSHFIQMLDLKADDAFQTGLGDGNDAPVLHMLAQKHAEIGGGHGALLVRFGQINEGQGSAGGNAQALLSVFGLYGE